MKNNVVFFLELFFNEGNSTHNTREIDLARSSFDDLARRVANRCHGEETSSASRIFLRRFC